jgi:Family of unknown function (DUF5946)
MEGTSCPGCGLVTPSPSLATHAYIGASTGCWEVFCEALMSDLGYCGRGHLVGDAYAAQHPGVPERPVVQPVCVHLVALCAAIERAWPRNGMVDVRRRAASSGSELWCWLVPEPPLGTLTVGDVMAAGDPAGRASVVWDYVEGVWQAYAAHHDQVRSWTDELGLARRD